MKGLLTKDFFLMCENKLFFIMFIIISSMFITINSTSLLFVLGYDVFLCTFMSISTINYDSMDNGMPFIMTLPLKRKIYVLEKYIFIILVSLFASIIFGAALWMFSAFSHQGSLLSEWIASCVGIFAAAVLMTSAAIPIQLKFGNEKGRIFTIIFMAAIILISLAVIEVAQMLNISFAQVENALSQIGAASAAIIAAVSEALLVVISFFISVRIMEKKQF